MKIALATFLLAGCAVLVANAQPQQSAFEVASIKLLTPEQLDQAVVSGGGRIVTQDPSLLSYPFITLKILLMRAYDLKPFQISGPDWLNDANYQLSAKLPAGATEDQIPLMLQQLLTERFQMTVRWDTRQETGYALVVDKGGPKLTLSADQSIHENDRPDTPRSLKMCNPLKMGGGTMAALAAELSNLLAEPVTDSTGLNGRFDVTLNLSCQEVTAAGQGPSSSTDNGADTKGATFDAVRDLGLRLEPQKVQVKHLIVVQANRIPTEN
jgi:uncharacterized protein (TIGR03435 family)